MRIRLCSQKWKSAGLLSAAVLLSASHVRAAETAKVLPQGISRARLVGVVTGEITEKYNSAGILEPVTNSLNRSLTVQDFVQKEPRLGQLVNAMNSLQPGLGDQLLGANLYSGFSTQVSQYLLAYEYGITSRFSLGIRVPLVKRSVRTSFSASGVNNALSLAGQVGALSPEMTDGFYNLGTQQLNTEFFEHALFTSKGYEVPHDFDKTELGDVELGGKYNFYQNERLFLSAQAGVRVPVGSTPSLNHVVDTGSGGGAWGTGISLFQEYEAAPMLTFGAMQKVMAFLPDTRARAVPKNEADALPSLLAEDGQVRDVTRHQSLQFEGEVSSTVRFFENAVSTWGAYQVAGKGEDRFSGDGDLYYAGLSKNSGFIKSCFEVGVAYSTIPAFRKKKFSVPMDIEALYNTTLTGTNTPLASYGRMDLKLYF